MNNKPANPLVGQANASNNPDKTLSIGFKKFFIKIAS